MGIVSTLRTRLAIAALALVSTVAWGDPPTRAIRIANVNGPVSFLPSGESDWTQARVNRPVWTGDRLWIDRGARAELQLGGAAVFIAAESSVAVLDYDNDRAQLELTQGTVDIYVRSLDPNDSIEIDTPNLAFVVRRPGEYRIDVRPDGESTAVAVVRGEGEAFGARSAYTLRAGQGFRFFGTDLADYNAEPVQRLAAFDSWVATRVQRYERSASARYVSQDMIGYADLDSYGTWRTVSNYGAVWVPSRVDAEWAPYRYGHWNWVEPWGWTWIDDAPWGFAPFHYGRWAHVDNRYWAWVPGPRNAAPVYAPALVAFVGGDGFRVSASGGAGVAWFPLAPGEIYRPAYNASLEYFTRVNVTNTVVNVTNVTNVYNNPRTTDVRYVNINNVNAVTAVPAQAFVQAQPVQRAAVRMDRNALRATQVVAAAPIAPARASVAGAAPPAQARPDQRVVDRKVMARQAPPPASASFDRREEALKQQPGKPLDRADAARGAPPRANVTVVQAGPPPQAIPAVAPGERGNGKGRERNPQEPSKAAPPPVAKAPEPARPTVAAPPPAVQQPALPPQVAQPAPGERGRGNASRGQPEHPQPAAKPPEPARPSVAAPPPAVQQPERGRGNASRAQPEHPQPAAKAPEPARPSVAAPPPAVQQPAPPPPQVAQPAQGERGRGNASRGQPEHPQPAAKAPEPARPSVAAPPPAVQQPAPPPPQAAQPAPGERGRGNASRGQPENPQPGAKAPEPPHPTQAAPAPEAAPAPAPQEKQQGKRNRDDDGGQRGKGRD